MRARGIALARVIGVADAAQLVTPYAITKGGPYHRALRALGIEHDDTRNWWRLALVWLLVVYAPILVGELFVDGEWLTDLARINTHARALVALPLLVVAESLVETRAAGVGRYLLESRLISSGELERYRAAIARTERVRNSALVELVLLGGAVLTTFVGYRATWFNLPQMILLRFLVLRWIWRWLLWGLFLWRISRLRLALRATHPDRLAGLGPLLGPAYGFACVAAAGSAALSGVWADLVIHEGAAAHSFLPYALAYVVTALTFALMPTFVFVPALYRTRKYGLAKYGAFAHQFVVAFEERWYNADGAGALGGPDLSSLCDLGGSYQVVAHMRVVPWAPRLLHEIAMWTILPMLPLAVIDLGILGLLQRLAKTLL